MLEELRKKSLHSMRVKLIICTIIIVVCMVITKASFITYLKGPTKLDMYGEWDVEKLEGQYVTLEINIFCGVFADEISIDKDTHDKTITSNCYICMKTDASGYADKLFGIKINSRDQHSVNAVMYDSTNTKSFQVTGTFMKLSGEMLQLFDETIEEWYGVEGLEHALPYYIYDASIRGMDYEWIAFLTAIAFIAFVYAVIVIINNLRGYHDRYINRYLKKNPNETLSGIETDYFSATVIDKDYRMGEKYFFFAKGGTMNLLLLEEQVWAYYYERNGNIPVSRIQFYNLQHRKNAVNISNKCSVNSVLRALDTNFNHMVVGYDANLKRMYKNNFQEFLNIKYNPARSAAATEDTFYR